MARSKCVAVNGATAVFCVLVAMTLLASCQSSGPKAPAAAARPQPRPPADYTPPRAERLDLSGENCCAEFTATPGQILFLSRQRQRHAAFQVYAYDWEKRQERRLSFHDGDDQGPKVNERDNHLYYASTTDALKEDPPFLRQAMGRATDPKPAVGERPLWDAGPFDLYRADRDGSNVRRLTEANGFEGELDLHPSAPQMVYTAIRGRRSVLIRADRDGRPLGQITRGDYNEAEASFSPNGKELVFVRYSADLSTSEIWLSLADGRKAQKIVDAVGLNRSPRWHPTGKHIVFSSNRASLEDPTNHELYVVDRDGTCLRRLTYSLDQDLLPVFSPAGDWMLFTSNRDGAFQLYRMDFKPPACP